jgi:hypothetical protein
MKTVYSKELESLYIELNQVVIMSEALKAAWANMKLKSEMKKRIVKFYFLKVGGAVKRLKDSAKPNARVRFSVMELEKAAYSINVMSSLSPISNAEIADVVSEILHTK